MSQLATTAIFTGLRTPTPGSMSPWSNPGAWDSCYIAGVLYGWGFVPSVGGKVVVRRPRRHYRIDSKVPKGADGAQQTYQGIDPKEFGIEFHMWTEPQYDLVTKRILPAIKYAGTKGKIAAYTFLHVTTTLLDINAIEMLSIGAPEHVGAEGDRYYVLSLEVREYRPPPPLNVTTTPKVAPVPPNPMGPPQGTKPSTPIQIAIRSLNASRDKFTRTLGK